MQKLKLKDIISHEIAEYRRILELDFHPTNFVTVDLKYHYLFEQSSSLIVFNYV